MSSDFVKQTLRENLSRVLVPHVADGLWSIYDNALKACQRNGQPEKTLQTFQNLLTRIPAWNEETLNTEVERIMTASKCDYMEDLLLGVFVSYIRAFASLQQGEATEVNIDFERPSLTKFIHAYYNAAARKSWSQAYLFKTIGVTSEQQARNRRDIESILELTVNEVVDSFIPWRDISRAYFHAKQTDAPPQRPPTPAPPRPVMIEEENNEVHEFETEEEEDDEEQPPRLQLGEDIKLDEFEDDKASVDTEAELAAKEKENEPVSLNL